jgi:hypothetical protein
MTRAGLERFKHAMDGLAEKPAICDLFRRGYHVKEALAELNIPEANYRRWFQSDVEFRVQLYLAVSSR